MPNFAVFLSAVKTVIKAFCSVLYVLDCPLNDAFLIKWMDMVLQPQEPASLRMPCSTVSQDRMLPIVLLKVWTENVRPQAYFLSLDMLVESISLFAGSIATQSHTNSDPIFEQCLVNDKLFKLLFLWRYPLGIVLLNSVPDGNMIPFDEMWGQYLRCSSWR